MMLPNGWKKVKLGDVVKMSSGGTPSKDNASFWNGDIPWISALEMHKNFVEEAKLNITEDALKKGSSLAKKNDLLLLTRGSMLWKRIPVCLCLRDVAFNQDVKCLHTDKKLNSTFLLYWFGCMEPKIMHMVVGTGIGAGKLESRGILDLDINLPPIEEQKKIAATLSVWDSAIEKMEKLIEAKFMQKKTLTCKLIENQNDVKFKLGNVTIDKNKWERKRLGELLEFKNGVNVEKDKIGHGTKMISVLDILSDKPITYDNIRSSVALTTEELSIYSVHYGDVLFQRSSENYEDVGTSNVYIDEKCATFSGFVIRGKKIGAYNPFCLNAILRAPSARCQIMRKAAGAQHVNIGQESLANIQIFLPTLLEQKVIADVLSAIDDELTLLKQQLENYKKQKHGLMQKLLTGEWRVK